MSQALAKWLPPLEAAIAPFGSFLVRVGFFHFFLIFSQNEAQASERRKRFASNQHRDHCGSGLLANFFALLSYPLPAVAFR
jgi:hypothetical protein